MNWKENGELDEDDMYFKATGEVLMKPKVYFLRSKKWKGHPISTQKWWDEYRDQQMNFITDQRLKKEAREAAGEPPVEQVQPKLTPTCADLMSSLPLAMLSVKNDEKEKPGPSEKPGSSTGRQPAAGVQPKGKTPRKKSLGPKKSSSGSKKLGKTPAIPKNPRRKSLFTAEQALSPDTAEGKPWYEDSKKTKTTFKPCKPKTFEQYSGEIESVPSEAYLTMARGLNKKL